MRARTERRDAIRKIVRSYPVRTQRDLVAKLKEKGYSCTQATVSRDICDLGLKKDETGIYVLPEDLHLQHTLSEDVVSITFAENLIVIKCQIDSAAGVAYAVDNCGLSHVLGTVAGSDTVLVVSDSAKNAERLVDELSQLVGAA